MTKDTFLKIVDRKAKKLRIQGKYKVFFKPVSRMFSIAYADWRWGKEVCFSQELLSGKLNLPFVEAIIIHELEHIKNKMFDGPEYEQMLRKKYPQYGVAIDWAISDGREILRDVFGFTPIFRLP